MQRYHNLGEDGEKTDFKDLELAKQMIDLSPGCFTIIYETQDEIGNVEPLTMYKFTKNISTMISKENLFSLHMRFLNKEERI